MNTVKLKTIKLIHKNPFAVLYTNNEKSESELRKQFHSPLQQND